MAGVHTVSIPRGPIIGSDRHPTEPGRSHHADTATPLGPIAVAYFDAVFVDEYPKMVALAAAVAGDRTFAEDLAREAMTRLRRNWGRIQGFQSPGAWVRRVTINLALSQQRRLTDEARARLRLRSATARRLGPSAAEHQPVWDAVAGLPPKQRAAVALRYLEDRSVDEIADVLEVAPSTVRVHLHRAARTLRERLPDFDPRPLSAQADGDDQEVRP